LCGVYATPVWLPMRRCSEATDASAALLRPVWPHLILLYPLRRQRTDPSDRSLLLPGRGVPNDLLDHTR
jgi:hypothetical protein